MLKPERKKPNINFKSYLGVLGLAALAALIVIASTLIFGQTARKAADETTISLSKFYLEELADRNVYEISAELESTEEQLRRAVDEMRNADLRTDDALHSYLALIRRLNGLDFFAVMDESGMTYTAESSLSGIEQPDVLSEPITETRLYTTRNSRSKAMVLIAMPTESFPFGDIRIVSCIAGVDVDKIISAQQIQGEHNQVLCRLFDGDDGTCIVELEGRYADGSSIFDVWRNECTFSGEYSVERLISDWNNHTEGYAFYTANEGSTCLYYKPVPGTDWMVSVRLRQNAISTQILNTSNKILRGSWVQLAIVIMTALVGSFFAIRRTRKTQSAQFEWEKEETRLHQEAKASAERLRLQEKLLQEEVASGRQASVIQFLSKEYSSVYYADLEEDTMVPLRISDAIVALYGLETNKTYPFRETYMTYIQNSAAPGQEAQLLPFSEPAFLRKTLKDDEIFKFLYRIVRDGREQYAQLKIAKVEDETDFRHIVLGFAVVDDEVRAEQETRRVLKEALAQAEQANRAKTAFLNNMSHDIRTPMNAIIGFTNIALKQVISPEVKNCLEKISESSEHLLTLINDVLDISRIESGKAQFNPVPVDLTAIADVVLDITRGFLANRNVALEVRRINLEHPYVLADAVRIREVLVNILSNAVKFTEDGGCISFVTACRKGEDDEHIVVTYRISDTGIGMSEEFLEHIFDEFSQEESGARTQYKGTGLGMTITKRYVELMGGTISVESKKGAGSVFTVELPMELAEESLVKKQDAPIARESLKGVKVLMAEDNDLNAEIATVQLEELGMTVTRAADGKDAVTLFSENPPDTFDLILMDIMMPEMNGYEATKAIRNLKARPDGRTIPIIAITANAFAEDIQAAITAGMNGHIAKPLDMNTLAKSLKKWLP